MWRRKPAGIDMERNYATVTVSIPDMELGHWVTGSMGHLGHLSRPGHRVIILTRCATRVFPVFEKMPKVQNVHLKCWNDKSHCQVSAVGPKSLDVRPGNELLLLPMIIKNSLAWEYFFTRKSTCGVHYWTGSPGQLGLRVAGFPGHWVTKSPVPSLMYSIRLLRIVAQPTEQWWDTIRRASSHVCHPRRLAGSVWHFFQ